MNSARSWWEPAGGSSLGWILDFFLSWVAVNLVPTFTVGSSVHCPKYFIWFCSPTWIAHSSFLLSTLLIIPNVARMGRNASESNCLYIVKVKMYISCDSNFTPPGTCQIENSLLIHKWIHTTVSPVAMFSVVYNLKRFPSLGKWIHSVAYTHDRCNSDGNKWNVTVCLNVDKFHKNVDSKESFSRIPRIYYHVCTFRKHIKPTLGGLWVSLS